MTVPDYADNYSPMNMLGLFVKVLVLAAHVLAMLVPGLTMVGEQTQVVHAQMRAMAGHEVTMADMGSSETDQTIEMAGHPVDVVTGDDPLVSSLAFPPPGHPPKVAVI